LFGALQRKTASAFQALIDQRIAAGEVLAAPAPAADDAPEAAAAPEADAADDSTASAGEAATEIDDAAPAESE